MSISQLFILSRRGDTIIYRDFRRDVKKSNDIFFRNVNKEEDESKPPLFNVEGINFIYMKTPDLYFTITTLDNNSPNYFLEIIHQLMKVIKDHIGELTEESIRKNFVLIYEIIDEMIDFGYPQLFDTEQVKQFVFTEPQVELKNINTLKELFNKSTKSNENTKKSIVVTNDVSSKNEIYVDIIEKITCLFNRNGSILNSSIDGAIKMKSYLKNSPELKIQLSDDVAFTKSKYSSGRMEITDYNFCQGVRARDLEVNRTMFIIPPEGEFVLMNYHIDNEFAPPFKVYSLIEESDYKLDVKTKVQANFANTNKGGNIIVIFKVPLATQSVYFDLPKPVRSEQKVDFNQNDHTVIWTIPKMVGGTEAVLDTKMTLSINKPGQCRQELGPVTMTFEIPNFNVSHMEIKELKVMSNDTKYNAMRWVRKFTQANSYITRIG